jgi:hypothetical protein
MNPGRDSRLRIGRGIDFNPGILLRRQTVRFTTTILAGLFLASVGIGTAHAAPPSAVVLPAKGTLNPDGSVDITMKVRCNETQQAFEWSIDVRQGTIFGGDFAGPIPGLITCNGQFQTVETHVVGVNGPYVAGAATVQALVQLGDAGGGADTELEDLAVVRLRP